MRLVFFGTPQFAVPSLERLVQHPDLDVVAVVTQPDKRRGRGKQLMPSPVKAVAVDHHIPVWQPRRVKKDAETLDLLQQANADAFVVVAYGQILSAEILAMPRLGCINGHGSLLPAYRGAAPIQWCIYDGVLETGMTTMLMDEGMDTGAMLLKRSILVGLLDNAVDVAKALSSLAADLLVETLFGLDNHTVTPEPQDHEQATYASLIQKEDFELDWSRGAIALHNQIRGFYPNCVSTFRGDGLKVKASIPLNPPEPYHLPGEFHNLAQVAADLQSTPDLASAPPGTVVALLKNQGFVVQTGDGLLMLQDVQLAGKRSQSGWDFANGTRLTVGECLGQVEA
ncbi:MAG: methionyl-tRNA formyltransferase [Elainellaceae cyanobacterium]